MKIRVNFLRANVKLAENGCDNDRFLFIIAVKRKIVH